MTNLITMIEKTFAKGNYNEWEKFIKETLPQQSELFRSKLIPAIDETLVNMLGGYSEIHKNSIDITPIFNEYLTIKADIIYTVDDFKAPDVPTDAVKRDEDAIREFLEEQFKDIINIESIKINISTGELEIVASIAVKF